MATTSIPRPADSPEVRRYNRIQRWLSLADAVIGFALLVVLLVTGWTGKLRDWSYLGTHQRYFFAVFLYVLMFSVIAKVLSAPFDFIGFRLEHQYNLSNQKLRGWLWDECKGWLVGLVLGAIMVEIVYAIIRIAPQRWWIIAWAVFVGLFLLMAQLAPVVLMPIFYRFQPLENDGLRDRLTRLGERAGTRVRGVYEWKLSEKSKKANAALTGMGSTRRIILSDTLLQHYSDDEIEAVLAHELGHHVRRHILKGILMQVGITFFGFWLINQVLRFVIAKDWFPVLDPRLYDFANLPLIVLVATILGFLLMPALNAISRRHEREADRYAWENIPAIAPFISSMQKLADQNLAEREPSKVIECLFHSHPSIGKRIAAAEAWADKQPQTAAQSLS
ncbi:MAG TPA: M48 family metallopeptidase [Candidatus Limnocylindrales bacterium]|nr:M48 family metallopeptidase [Candidatus Limnocylindrales bacterium]